MVLYKYVRDFDTDIFGERIKLLTFNVVSQTKKCYVIDFHKNKNGVKYILKDNGNKKFARESKELALKDFIYKTKKCITYQKANLDISNEYLLLAEKIKTK